MIELAQYDTCRVEGSVEQTPGLSVVHLLVHTEDLSSEQSLRFNRQAIVSVYTYVVYM
jgi:hypothetical protein